MSETALDRHSSTLEGGFTEPVRRAEGLVVAASGETVFRRSWVSRAADRALLLVHGFAEHSGRYDHLGEWFALRRCSVYAYDLRGHGRSPGRRGHVDRFEDFLDDLQAMVEALRAEQAGLPLAIAGHSLGGLIAASFAIDRDPDVVGVVTSGALVAFPQALPRSRVRMARILRRLVPRLAMSAGLDATGLSRDPEVVRRYLDDPLVFRRMTASFAAEVMAAVERYGSRADVVRVPMLLLHGEADPLCPPEGSRAFHAGLSSPDSELRVYPELRHEIFNEPEREQVFRDLLAWLEVRT